MLGSAAKWLAQGFRPGRQWLTGRTLKRRVAGRIRGDRAGCPIEADQYRMYCEVGPVKVRVDARAVPDLDPGPLAREHSQPLSAGSVHAAIEFSPPRQSIASGLRQIYDMGVASEFEPTHLIPISILAWRYNILGRFPDRNATCWIFSPTLPRNSQILVANPPTYLVLIPLTRLTLLFSNTIVHKCGKLWEVITIRWE